MVSQTLYHSREINNALVIFWTPSKVLGMSGVFQSTTACAWLEESTTPFVLFSVVAFGNYFIVECFSKELSLVSLHGRWIAL
ncbi:MAG TPA: hypothetical protein VFA15_06500, partial [Nitrososphaera sp.]|nr:hypothetical protein [Nitrososphaera sp.]